MDKIVTTSYLSKYKDPIILDKGYVVKLGEEETVEKWKGWIWATHENVSAWIPKLIVETGDEKTGIITEYYTSKELNVNEGDIVAQLRELNGWLWVKKADSEEEGWIPKEVTIDIETK